MLKISLTENRRGRRLILEGQLTPPWVEEVRGSWHALCENIGDKFLQVDVRNVTAVSPEGESLLRLMMREGAIFCCRGVLVRHTLKQLAHELRSSPKTRSTAKLPSRLSKTQEVHQ
jgi:hypothetical protein